MSSTDAPDANLRTLDPALAQRLRDVFGAAPYNQLLGIQVEELAEGYARLRLPFKDQLHQPAGYVHGGAMASLIDTAAAVAIFTALDRRPKRIATIDMHVHYLDGVQDQGLIAEATLRRRGRSISFVGVEVRDASGVPVAHGELSFRVVL